jgi:hypothetical protein
MIIFITCCFLAKPGKDKQSRAKIVKNFESLKSNLFFEIPVSLHFLSFRKSRSHHKKRGSSSHHDGEEIVVVAIVAVY